MNHIYLTGLMGCGKSHLGYFLSTSLKLDFIDLDQYIIQKHQKTIPQIFEEKGEAVFREMESSALEEISGLPRHVVATGGGIILKQANISCMKKSGVIIYIRRPIPLISKSLQTSERPLLKEGAQKLQEIYDSRKERYESTADLIFDNLYDSAEEALIPFRSLIATSLPL